MSALRLYFVCLFIALPWLNPFATGPSATVLPWLVSLACVGLGLLVARTATICRVFAIYFIAACALFYWATATLHPQNRVEALTTVVALLCVLVMVYVGAGLRGAGLAATWLAVALLSSVMAQLQYFGIEHYAAPWVSASGTGEAFANLRQRNQFATLTGMGLAALLYILQQHDGKHTRMVAWAALVLLAVSNAASSSRTGFVQWVLLAGLAWCWRAHLGMQTRRVAYAAVPAYIAAALLMPFFTQWASVPTDSSFSRMLGPAGEGSRLWLYANVIDLIAQKPWAGWGWRELAYAHYSHSFSPRFMLIVDNAHSLPLHLAVELGLPAALVLCGLPVWWVWRAKPWRERDATRQLAWAVLLLLAVHSMTEYPLWYGPFLMTLGLCLGILLGANPARVKTVASALATTTAFRSSFSTRLLFNAKWSLSHYFRALAATLLIAFAGYAGWDYWRISQIYLSPDERASAYQDNTLRKVSGTWLFQRQVRFAELVTTTLTPQNAAHILTLALDLLHYSPEPRVIEAAIEAAVMLHFDDVAAFHIARYKEAFSKEYAAWSALNVSAN
jgi:Virulence factor membrane-bound polymerase, C-terminal/O-Antigen ligase/Protein glycosylation ligase